MRLLLPLVSLALLLPAALAGSSADSDCGIDAPTVVQDVQVLCTLACHEGQRLSLQADGVLIDAVASCGRTSAECRIIGSCGWANIPVHDGEGTCTVAGQPIPGTDLHTPGLVQHLRCTIA